jgi:outer membrane protein assembly factor BamB
MATFGGFDDFTVDIGEYEVKQVREWDRMWRIETGGSIDTRPLIYDNKVYFGSYNHNLYCLDVRTGKLLWKYKTRDRIGNASPVEHDGIIYVGSYDKNMYAFDARTGGLIWKFKTEGRIHCNAAIKNDTVYFSSYDRNFYALDARTGALRWKFRTYACVLCDPTFFGDMVIFGSYDRNFYCLDLETGRLIWKLTAEREIVNAGGFAIKDGCIYLCAFDNLVRKVDIKTGSVLWKKRFGQYGLTCGTVIYNDMLLVASEDGVLYAMDLDGNVAWKFATTKPIGRPAVWNERIYFTCEDFNLYCLSLEGKVVWKFRTQEMNWWEPTLWEGRVYFGSYDCHFYVLEAETGDLVWKFRTEGSPSNYPPPYDQFEVELKIPESEVSEESKEKRYDFGTSEEEETSDFYKSRITYQVSTQYASKGKYQVDSKEEEF